MHISGLFKGITIKDLKPPLRRDIIKKFVEHLNHDIDVENEGSKVKRKHMAPAFVAFKLSHLKVDDLWYFLGYCKEAKHFSKTWWWALKSHDSKDK